MDYFIRSIDAKTNSTIQHSGVRRRQCVAEVPSVVATAVQNSEFA
jgi:hypothetical protein